ncbi:MAG: hypothetical protein DMF51_14555 [Acidobacteria bacterium]|nr:MAG: hypothetical protein DMF51_14555 [Acidobacteriota bacterium]
MSAQMMERGRSDLKADLFIGVVVVSGVAVVASSLRHIFTDGLEARHLAWLGIAALTLLIGRLSVKLPFPNCRVSFSDALIFLSVLVYGGDFGTLTAALDGFASSTRQNGTAHKKAFNTAGMALSVHLSAWVFARLLPDGASSGHGLSPADLLLPVTALALSQYVLNTALVATAVALKDHASFLATWLEASPWAAAAYVAGSLAAAAVFLAVRDLGVLLAFAVLPFPFLLHLTYRACLGRLLRQKQTAPLQAHR